MTHGAHILYYHYESTANLVPCDIGGRFRKEGMPMRTLTTADLTCMEVINLCDGGKIGFPSAVEFNVDDGCITALIVPRDCGFLSFGRSECFRIPWCRIECVGEDTILVKLTAAELTSCQCRQTGKKR